MVKLKQIKKENVELTCIQHQKVFHNLLHLYIKKKERKIRTTSFKADQAIAFLENNFKITYVGDLSGKVMKISTNSEFISKINTDI